jgi:hypothetical protein
MHCILTIKRGENGFQIGLRAEQTISKGELLAIKPTKQYQRNYTIFQYWFDL